QRKGAIAKQAIGRFVVAHRGIAAVERGPPARIPEVLEGNVHVPGGRQVEIGGSEYANLPDEAAENGITQGSKGGAVPVDLAPVRVRRLEDVAQRAFSVVDLG